ncbi:hypothetical protein Tco_0094414, partial [Tanacetum coccineum]
EDQPYAEDASPTTESLGYIADSDSMKEDTNEESIDYLDEPEDDDEDLKKDGEDDPEEDPSKEHEPEDEDTKEEEPFEGSDETKPFEEDETAVTPPPPGHRGARIPASLGHRAAMIRMRDDIPEEDMPLRRRFILTAPPPGYDVAESFVAAAAARPPRGHYDFTDTVEAGQGLIRSPGHDARTIARAADRAEDVSYVRALQASEHMMMTSIEEVNLRVNYQAQVRRDIRLEIDVVIGQRTAYETELHEVHQAYLSSKAWNKALYARLETLKTHMSRIEW